VRARQRNNKYARFLRTTALRQLRTASSNKSFRRRQEKSQKRKLEGENWPSLVAQTQRPKTMNEMRRHHSCLEFLDTASSTCRLKTASPLWDPLMNPGSTSPLLAWSVLEPADSPQGGLRNLSSLKGNLTNRGRAGLKESLMIVPSADSHQEENGVLKS